VRRHLPVTLAGLLALGVALTATFAQPVFLERLELTLLDWRFRLRGEQPPQAPVVVAAIDAHSIDVLGRWPWRRTVMAELIDRLSEAGVAAIALDIVFSEPEHNAETDALRAARASLPDGTSPATARLLDEAIAASDTDAILADAIRRSERTVAGFFFRTGAGEPTGVGVPLEDALELVRRGRLKLERPGVNKDHILRCVEVEPNIAPVAAAAARLGFFSVRTDADGVVRRSPLLTRCGGETYVSLDLAVAELLVGQPAMVIGDAEGVQEVRVGDFVFPTDDTGSLLIDYRGGAKAFPHLSIADILDGTVGAEELEGTVVVVGATEVGVRDVHANPFQAAYPGVEVHANVLDNLIIERTLRKPEGLLFWIERPALVLLGLLVIFVVPRLGSTLRGAVFAGALLTAVTAGIVWAFVARSLWLELGAPALTILLVYFAVEITRSVTVEAAARRTRRTFATYVPPDVVEELTRNPDSFRLGGERRDMTVLFSDIADFTTISEQIGPERVIELLNVYLTPMTKIVFDSGGTLDKYIGDAVMAFWGAPLEVPEHPLRGVETALAMQEEIDRLGRERRDVAGLEGLHVRIGLHCGEVAVGNMGSELRFDYTVTGDVVNLSSRMEALNKYYRTRILASGELVERLPEGFVLREVDRVRAKGKLGAVTLVEVRGRRSLEDGEGEFLEAHAAGLAAYRSGRFEEARDYLETAQRCVPEDGASALLLERIAVLEREPPADWDGVWSFETK
jgi:adenylate cyclase